MEPITRITQVKVGHGTHAGMTGKHNEDSYGFFAWRDEQGKRPVSWPAPSLSKRSGIILAANIP
jgi:hypothetical protein